MSARYQDIRETINGYKILTYSYGRKKGSSGKTFTMTLAGAEQAVKTGDIINLKGIDYLVTSKDFNVTPNGYTTDLNMVEKAASDLVKMAPKKTLMFMSMTADEKEEFEIANMDDNGVVDFSGLEYIPLIRVCSAEDFAGGWLTLSGSTEDGVIDYLANLMGVQLVCNVRPYWVRQVQADVASSFFDVILSLVNFLNPIISIDGNTLYILQRPMKGGSMSIEKIGNFKQSEVFNYNNKCTYVKVVGGLGKWIRDKFKGKVEPEKETTITNTVGQETGLQIWAKFGGSPAAIARMMGERGNVAMAWGSGPVGMTDTTISEETWRLDPFGNQKALLRRTQTTHNAIMDEDTFKSTETYKYDFLPECFERPRVVSKNSKIGKYLWEMTKWPGGCVRRFKADVDDIDEGWLYAPNGTLLHESMVRKANCLVLVSSGFFAEETIIELEFGDNVWNPDGVTEPQYDMRVVEEKSTRYRQMTPTMYQKAMYHRSIGALRRRLGDGTHSMSCENIRGRVPKYAPRYRTLQVYAEKIWGPDPMEVPALIVSNSNIVDWADAEAILQDILQNNVDFDYTLQRTYVVPAEIEMEIGWQIDFPEVKVGIGGMIYSVNVTDGHIASYAVVKDAGEGAVRTTIVVEGKVKLS